MKILQKSPIAMLFQIITYCNNLFHFITKYCSNMLAPYKHGDEYSCINPPRISKNIQVELIQFLMQIQIKSSQSSFCKNFNTILFPSKKIIGKFYILPVVVSVKRKTTANSVNNLAYTNLVKRLFKLF